MLSFGFSTLDEGLTVLLCEETIRYHTDRGGGIPIGATIIVRSLNSRPKYLGIWHRAQVAPLRIDETADLLDEQNPYTRIFLNLAEGRGDVTGPSTIAIRLFDPASCDSPTLLPDKTGDILVRPLGGEQGLRVSYPVISELLAAGIEAPEARLVPYTYAQVGPFAEEGRIYAVRATAVVADEAFLRLVAENPVLGTRYYEVCGTSEIRRKITELDFSRLLRACSPEVYGVYRRHFDSGLNSTNCLVPDFYSVLLIDAPDSREYAPFAAYTIHCKDALKEMTSELNPGIFQYEDLEGLDGRIFWFVNKDHRQDFSLWFEGPMAEVNSRRLVAAGSTPVREPMDAAHSM